MGAAGETGGLSAGTDRADREPARRGDLLRCEFDVVVFACGQVEAHAALDLRVVIAAHLEAVAQGDALGGARRHGKGGQQSSRDD